MTKKPDLPLASRFRLMADELRSKAEFPPYANIRDYLLDFAEQWESLAVQAETAVTGS